MSLPNKVGEVKGKPTKKKLGLMLSSTHAEFQKFQKKIHCIFSVEEFELQGQRIAEAA